MEVQRDMSRITPSINSFFNTAVLRSISYFGNLFDLAVRSLWQRFTYLTNLTLSIFCWLFLACGLYGATILANKLGAINLSPRYLDSIASTILWYFFIIAFISLQLAFITAVFFHLRVKREEKEILQIREFLIDLNNGHFTMQKDRAVSPEIADLLKSILEKMKLVESQKTAHEYEINALISELVHDLIKPLTLIKIDSDYLSSNSEVILREELAVTLNAQSKNVSAMRHLLEQFLELMRIRHQSKLVKVASINLNSLIYDLIACLNTRADNLGVEIKLTEPRQPLFIVGDPRLIERALHNLIDNALIYSFRNSYVNIDLLYNNEKITVRVKDDGIGIEGEELNRIGTPLFRGQGAKAVSGGSGLGLSIVKRVIELHQGEFRIQSTKGKGTVVELQFKNSS